MKTVRKTKIAKIECIQRLQQLAVGMALRTSSSQSVRYRDSKEGQDVQVGMLASYTASSKAAWGAPSPHSLTSLI